MKKAFGYMGFAVSLMLFIMAALIAFRPDGLFENLEGYQRNMIAFILAIYGLFRLARAYKAVNEKG